jgi:hypothetical protein
MPGKSERLKVEINEASTQDIRTFSITLAAPLSDFQVTDILRQRGVINGLDSQLKQTIKDTTDAYIKSAEELIASLANSSSTKRKARSNSTDDRPSTTPLQATRS